MLVGARLNWLLEHGRPPRWGTSTRFIQLDISPDEFDSNRPIEAPVLGDIANSMSQLLAGLSPGRIKAKRAWLDEIEAKTMQNVARLKARLAENAKPMNFYGALGAIRDVLANHEGAFVVNEGANTLDFGRNILPMREPRKRLDCGTWGVMGVGLGYAIAAAVETGESVVAVEGDSAFGFSGMEVETICRYGLPIVVVLFNNGGVYKGDEINSHSSDPAPTVLLRSSRYDKLIEAFGGTGYEAPDPAALSEALKKALASRKPSLINCTIDPSAGTESGHLQSLNAESSLRAPKAK
jgi:oxalyl-CoA decarboxylase